MRFLEARQIEMFDKKTKKSFLVNGVGNLKFKAGIVIFILISFFILNATPFSKVLRGFFYSFSRPIQEKLWEKGKFISDFFETLVYARRLKEENEELESKNRELITKIAELEDLRKENKILRRALELDLQEEFDLKICRVIGREIGADYLIIDKGAVDGISFGVPVITQDKSLVGRISEVYETISKVQLLTSKDSSFDVEIFEKEIYGLAKGKRDFKLLLDLVPKEKELKEGDKVVTSALGGNFPRGLLVGDVIHIDKPDLTSFQTAEIKPSFELKELSSVFVIINFAK